MASESSLPCSQEIVPGAYTEPDKSTMHCNNLIYKTHFNSILPFTPRFSNWYFPSSIFDADLS